MNFLLTQTHVSYVAPAYSVPDHLLGPCQALQDAQAILIMSPSSSSLFTVGDTMQRISPYPQEPAAAGVPSPPANTQHDSPGPSG